MKRIFPKGTSGDQILHAVGTMVRGITLEMPWQITFEPWRKPRSNAQNNYLNGVVYPMILEAGGELLGGYTRQDLHEYMLGEWGGWETLTGLGHTRVRPLRRSSKLTRAEFTDFLYFIENKCIELGIGPLPEPIYREDAQ
jgi:hypothetical protein